MKRNRGALVLTAWLLSCAGKTTGASGGSANGRGSPENDGGRFEFTGGDAAAGALAVSLPPSLDVGCSGACITLSLVIAGGDPPYTVRWGDGSTGAAARQVCPSATTTYTATVTDASGHAGDLVAVPAQASASTTVTVSPGGCSGATDGGASDGTSGDGSSFRRVAVACTASFTSPDSWSSGSALREGAAAVAVDPAGNLLVTADFGTGYLGDLTVPKGDGDAVMVAKFDPECRLLWSREYAGAGASIITNVIAADPSGDVIVGGMFQTSGPFSFQGLDLGDGSYASTNWRAFVTKLDPTGKTLWVYTAAPASSGGDMEETTDLAVDASGNIVLAMSDLPSPGGAPAGDAIVKLDSAGQPVFVLSSSTFAPAADVMQSVALASDSSIWSVATNSTSGDMTLAHLGADGSVLATQAVAAPAMPSGDDVGAAVRIGPSGDMVLSWGGHPAGFTVERWLRDYDPAGHVRWSTSFDISGGFDPAQLVRIDADGNAWIGDWLSGSQYLPFGTLESANGAVELLQVGTDGAFRSADLLPPVATDAGVREPAIADMALGPGRTLLIAGWTYPTGFMVTKLQL